MYDLGLYHSERSLNERLDLLQVARDRADALCIEHRGAVQVVIELEKSIIETRLRTQGIYPGDRIRLLFSDKSQEAIYEGCDIREGALGCDIIIRFLTTKGKPRQDKRPYKFSVLECIKPLYPADEKGGDDK